MRKLHIYQIKKIELKKYLPMGRRIFVRYKALTLRKKKHHSFLFEKTSFHKIFHGAEKSLKKKKMKKQ
jgi:hypothetical protein